MQVSQFDFDLPKDLIAQRPARPRDSARLLVVGAGRLQDCTVGDLPDVLRAGDLLVFNDTRVIPARLIARRGAAIVEVTLLEAAPDGAWRALARPARRCRPGDLLQFADDFEARVAARGDGGEITLVFAGDAGDLPARLRRHGSMPLPPYIRRPRGGDVQDRIDYQTLFAREEGAVAAPTAALHFTDPLLARLAARGIGHTFLTLHVGAGTFLPVKADDTADHVMHAERYRLGEEAAAAIERARRERRRVVAVGTTVLRVLETVALERGRIEPAAGWTRLFVTPGFVFRAVDLLMTNFHLPRSTLFMLVAAFAGLERMQSAYRHAIAERYRFYSYGDACLLERARSEVTW